MQTFIIKTEQYNLSAGERLYLHDKYLNQYSELQENAQYIFNITSDTASQGNNRFELVANTQPQSVAQLPGNDKLQMTLTPNPAGQNVTIAYNTNHKGVTSLRLVSLTGAAIVNMNLGEQQSGSVNVGLDNFAAGVYMVELRSGTQIITKQLIKD